MAVPKYLHEQGLRRVIPPVPTQSGGLWASLPPFAVILYPFIEGLNGFQRRLTGRQWAEFGAAMRRFHTTEFPPHVTRGVRREAFSPRFRNTVRLFLERIRRENFSEPVAAEMALFLNSNREETLALVERAETLVRALTVEPPAFILCHGDIHGWNLLIAADGNFFMVDWDTLVFAPKERDLMFIGAGLHGFGRSPQAEEALFYQGYGEVQANPAALAYYRYERIVEDIAVYCEQIFLSAEGSEDRKQSLEYLKANFLPGGAIEMARRSDRTG